MGLLRGLHAIKTKTMGIKRLYVCTVMFLGLYLILSMLLSKAFGRDVGAVLGNGVWLTAYTIFFGWIPWLMTRDYQQ